MDHDMVGFSQWSAGDGMKGMLYCGVTVIQDIALSGVAFNKMFVFREFLFEIAFVKVTKDNN